LDNTEEIKKKFTKNGGVFITTPAKIAFKLKNIKAFIFDWDGVFNNGEKDEKGSSTFSEIDSMGPNLLRFAYWIKTDKLPVTAILSGEQNSAAFYLSKREHFTSCYYKIANKALALEHFCTQYNIKVGEIAFVFDDVLDLTVSRVVGLRIFINRQASASPLFDNFVRKNKLADYITASGSGNFAVREACELMIGLQGIYNKVVTERMNYTSSYKKYTDLRNLIPTSFFTTQDETIVEINQS
jgi:3-deoxy-D-manno-octulosonate 8-phosphate phosphatase (KDO 8-P phosphatase)